MVVFFLFTPAELVIVMDKICRSCQFNSESLKIITEMYVDSIDHVVLDCPHEEQET